MTQLITQSDFRTGIKPTPSAQGSEVLCVKDSFSFATTKSMTDIAALFPLPVDHVPVDVIFAPSDGDTGSSLTMSVGLLVSAGTSLSTATDDGGAVWISESTAAQTGVIGRPTTIAITKVAPSSTVRYVGVTIIANGSATAVTGTLTMTYRAAKYGA